MPVKQLIKTEPNRIIVITLRFLGDTLLTTPLISSLKQAYPMAILDVLTFQSNAGMLEGNPHINQIICLKNKSGIIAFGELLVSLFRKYDLAISTQAGDRPTLIAVIAGKSRIGFVPDEPTKAWWKKRLLSAWLVFSADYNHVVLENLRFCQILGIKAIPKLTPPSADFVDLPLPSSPYVVIHTVPQWRYKEWHMDGWRELINYLAKQQITVVLTGSGNPAEQRKLEALEKKLESPVTNLAGKLSLAQLSALIKHALFFIGPDTGITHLAAATGTLTFAIFGPTDPHKWAPWPFDFQANHSPFAPTGSGRVNNVYLIQGKNAKNCVPCQREGCQNNRESHSECLDTLTVQKVIEAIKSTRLDLIKN